MSLRRCQGMVFKNYHERQCGATASLEHEGLHYCKTHHPPTVESKREKKRAERSAEWEAQAEDMRVKAREAAEVKRRADLYDELLEALKLARQIIGHPDDEHTQLIDAAIAKATEAAL